MIATMCIGLCDCCNTTCTCRPREQSTESWDYIIETAHALLDREIIRLVEEFYKLFHYFRPIIIWLVFKLQSIRDKLLPRQKDYG